MATMNLGITFGPATLFSNKNKNKDKKPYEIIRI